MSKSCANSNPGFNAGSHCIGVTLPCRGQGISSLAENSVTQILSSFSQSSSAFRKVHVSLGWSLMGERTQLPRPQAGKVPLTPPALHLGGHGRPRLGLHHPSALTKCCLHSRQDLNLNSAKQGVRGHCLHPSCAWQDPVLLSTAGM